MSASKKSCAVALPTQRNCATPENSATDSATAPHQTGRKPASIQELRAQLQAQHGRNQWRNSNATEPEKVAPDFEVCGEYTPYCCPISPELVDELHRLIAQYAALYRLADAATARIIDAAKRQPAATVPESIAFFKKSIKEHNNQTKGFTS